MDVQGSRVDRLLESAEGDVGLQVDHLPDRAPGFLSCCLGAACLPCMLLCSCYTVDQNEDVVIQYWGAYSKTVTEPGCHFDNMCGRTMRKISRRQRTVDLANQKMVDVTGSPLQVSGVVQYYFNKSKRTALQAQNPESLVHDLASATLKRIVSRYPYEAPEGEHSLKTEANEIGEEFCAELQKKVEVAGAKIVGFSFNEMSYAPEVASGMLKRQQAGALIQARRLIVDGAVSITSDAIEGLASKGIHMGEEDKARLVSNLLTALCSESNVAPVLPLGSRY